MFLRCLNITLCIVAVILFVSGCGSPLQSRTCPGKASLYDSITELNNKTQKICSFKVTGRCRLQFYESGKLTDESFDVKLWCSPPSYLYLQGDIAFNPRGIITGCNDEEFWFLIKPHFNSYWFGSRSAGQNNGMMINPQNLLNVLIPEKIEDVEDWNLSQENGLDVLTSSGRKIHIDRCDYNIRGIEYVGQNGSLVTIELDNYIDVSNNFSIPAIIEMTIGDPDDMANSVTFKLNIKTVRSTVISQKQRSKMFSRPRPDGFDHVYEIINGRAKEQ